MARKNESGKRPILIAFALRNASNMVAALRQSTAENENARRR